MVARRAVKAEALEVEEEDDAVGAVGTSRVVWWWHGVGKSGTWEHTLCRDSPHQSGILGVQSGQK